MESLRRVLRALPTPLMLIALLLVALLLSSLGPAYVAEVALLSLVTGILVVGLYIFVGNSGILSFGHLAFAMIGGYAGALLSMNPAVKAEALTNPPGLIVHATASPFFAVLIAGGIAAVVSAVVAVPLMRISGLTAGLASFAVLLAAYVVAGNWSGVTNGQQGLINLPTSTTKFSAFCWLAFAILAAWAYQRSRFGTRLRAAREDEIAARAIGVRVAWERGLAFVLSAFVVGVGGALYALSIGVMSPGVTYLDLTLIVITMLVVGGLTSLSGAVIGTIVISTLQEVLTRAEEGSVLGLFSVPATPGVAETGLALVLLVLLILRPGGLMGQREMALPRRVPWVGARSRPSATGTDAQPEAGALNDAGAAEPALAKPVDIDSPAP